MLIVDCSDVDEEIWPPLMQYNDENECTPLEFDESGSIQSRSFLMKFDDGNAANDELVATDSDKNDKGNSGTDGNTNTDEDDTNKVDEDGNVVERTNLEANNGSSGSNLTFGGTENVIFWITAMMSFFLLMTFFFDDDIRGCMYIGTPSG